MSVKGVEKHLGFFWIGWISRWD